MGTVGKMINVADSHLQYLSGVTEVRFASAQTAHIWHSGVWLTPAADTGSFSKPSLLIIMGHFTRQLDDGGEGPVVDVPVGLYVPPVDGPRHAGEHVHPAHTAVTRGSARGARHLSGCCMVHAPGPSLAMWASTPAAL